MQLGLTKSHIHPLSPPYSPFKPGVKVCGELLVKSPVIARQAGYGHLKTNLQQTLSFWSYLGEIIRNPIRYIIFCYTWLFLPSKLWLFSLHVCLSVFSVCLSNHWQEATKYQSLNLWTKKKYIFNYNLICITEQILQITDILLLLISNKIKFTIPVSFCQIK